MSEPHTALGIVRRLGCMWGIAGSAILGTALGPWGLVPALVYLGVNLWAIDGDQRAAAWLIVTSALMGIISLLGPGFGPPNAPLDHAMQFVLVAIPSLLAGVCGLLDKPSPAGVENVCMTCGYPLAGIRANRCPECGAEFRGS